LLFSATMPAPIKKLADKFLSNPKQIEVSRPASTNLSIDQSLAETTSRGKRETLRELLRTDGVTTAIIFSNRKTTVRDLAQSLGRHGFKAGQIHGDMEQPERLRELDRFKSGEINILVASDVAARGLDIKGVSHVFNFDVPWHPDDYVHRIGRTGRGGATGTAITLVTPEDAEAIEAIEKLQGNKIPRRAKAVGEAVEVEAEEPRRESRRGGRDRGERSDRGERREKKAEAPRAERPAPRAEVPAPREAKRDDRRPRRDDRRRDFVDDEPDDGWNGPVPSFLSVSLG
jgi:superfamily II DNA/RNA helicase